jgi:thiamine biosynthesis lipoprotein
MYKESRILMDTFSSITVVASSKAEAKEAIEAGFGEIQKLETLLNYFSPESELSAINNAAGVTPVKVSKEIIEILTKAMNIAEDTAGAFDPTIAPVIKLWKFSKVPSDSSLPSGEAVERALQRIGYRKVSIDWGSSEVFLEEKGMEIDLGGIAKGYAADKAVLAIKSFGINSALVAIAGDIRGFGVNVSQQAWKVGIQNPRPESDSERPWEDIFATIQLKDSAISTSGDYQRFFIRDGKRYHHILDPVTGYSAESGLISSTVIAPEGYLTDGLSTAVLILGAEKGIQLLESKGLGGVLVDAEKKIHLTINMRDNIVILDNAYQTIK